QVLVLRLAPGQVFQVFGGFARCGDDAGAADGCFLHDEAVTGLYPGGGVCKPMIVLWGCAQLLPLPGGAPNQAALDRQGCARRWGIPPTTVVRRRRLPKGERETRRALSEAAGRVCPPPARTRKGRAVRPQGGPPSRAAGNPPPPCAGPPRRYGSPPCRLQAARIRSAGNGPQGTIPSPISSQFDFGAVFLDRLDQVFALDAHPHGQGGGDEHRGIDPEPDPDRQGQREVVQRGTAEEEHR